MTQQQSSCLAVPLLLWVCSVVLWPCCDPGQWLRWWSGKWDFEYFGTWTVMWIGHIIIWTSMFNGSYQMLPPNHPATTTTWHDMTWMTKTKMTLPAPDTTPRKRGVLSPNTMEDTREGTRGTKVGGRPGVQGMPTLIFRFFNIIAKY